MTEMRYSRHFKKGIAVILFCIVLFGSVIVYFIIFKVQYDRLVSGMESLEATIVDIDLDVHVRGPDEQEILIEYEVDGVTYRRELKTDTALSFAAGSSAHYAVGDGIQIYYDPQNPEIIASPRSIRVGYFWLVFGLISLALGLYCLIVVWKNRRTFLVTQAEYVQEGEELKRRKAEEKQQTMQDKLERKKNHVWVRRVLKMILIAVGTLLLTILLFHFFRGFIRGLTG